MKKVFILMISILMLFSFASCSPEPKGPVEPTQNDLAVLQEISKGYTALINSKTITPQIDAQTSHVFLKVDKDVTFEGVTFHKATMEYSMSFPLLNKLDFDCTTQDGKRHTMKMEVILNATGTFDKAEMILDGKQLKAGQNAISMFPGSSPTTRP